MKNEKLDIIILAGQSNSEGLGKGPLSEPKYEPCEDILHLNVELDAKVVTVDGVEMLQLNYGDGPFAISQADERVSASDNEPVADLSLTFAKGYKDEGYLCKDRKLLIIRAGVGGTGFMKKHWGLSDIVYLKMLEMIDYALSLNPENRLVAFLWHQGEHDAFERNSPETYEKQLETLINSVRERYSTPNLPFVCGDFVNEWKSENIEICEPIVEKIRIVADRVGGAVVETADLLSNNQKIGNGDGIHFCREAIYILGRRYFDAYKKIIEK